MDILTEAMKRAAQRRAMGGQAQAQPMPQEANSYTVKQTDQMGGQIDHSPENRAFANIDRRYPEMSDKTRGMDQGELRSREPSNEELARGGMQEVLPRSSADRLAPIMGALMDAAPVPAQVATAVGEGIVNQPFVAGKALSDAYSDPSLANLTNAGVQTAMTIPTAKGFAAALGVGATGLGIAGAQQAGLGFSSPAMADLSPADQARRAELERQLALKPGEPGYLKPGTADNPGPRVTAQRSIEDLNRKDLEDTKDRRNAALRKEEADAGQKRADEAAALAQKRADEATDKKRKDDAYSEAERRAYTARDDALKLKDPWRETPTGKIITALGGSAPFIAGAGGGAVARWGMGHLPVSPTIGGGLNLAARVGLPIIGGTGAAYGVNVMKPYHEAQGETINPEYSAEKALVENLPDGHPRKAAAEKNMADGDNYPRENFVKKKAEEQLDDWPAMLRRSAMEGAFSGITGSEIYNGISRMPKAIGAKRTEWHEGQALANEAEVRARSARSANQRQPDSERQLAVADGLAQPAANVGGASTRQAGGSSGGPNRELSTTPGQDQPLLPAPAGNPSSKPFIEPGAEYPAPAPLLEDGATARINQAPFEYKPTAPDQVDAMRRDQIRKVAEALDDTPKKKASTAKTKNERTSNSDVSDGLIIPPGIKANPNWAPYSSSARKAVTSMTLDDGLTLASKGSGRVVAKDLHGMLKSSSGREPTFQVNSTQSALDRLRKTMIANGDDPSKPITEATLRKYKNLDPGIFGIAGAGAAGLAASQSEDPHVAVARALMGY